MKRLAIINGRVIDPASGIDGLYNIYAMGGRVARVAKAADDRTEVVESDASTEVIDAGGMLVVPGLVDIHTHLRDPGYEYKETIETGAAAAIAGGFTTIACMANTNPVNDNASITRYIRDKASKTGINIHPIGAATVGMRGERLTEMGELKEAGCVAVSDDGEPVVSPEMMRRALEYSTAFSLPLITHAEDPSLAGCGVMNEGVVSTRLGLPGIPGASEAAMVARDIQLAELAGARLHIAHISTAASVELVRAAKARGVHVTAEVTPHHLTLTDEAVLGYDTNTRMNPPLRSSADVEAVVAGLADGTIDCIATDHAPHSSVEKDVEFTAAANGIIGLETAFSVVYGLVEEGALTLKRMVEAMTIAPARALKLSAGSLKVGSRVDAAIVDLGASWTVDTRRLKSKSKNTPWAGLTLKARVVKTISNGNVVYALGE